MNNRERSPYLDDKSFKDLEMPGLSVEIFLLLNDLGLYNRFKELPIEARHEVASSFYDVKYVNLFPENRDRLPVVIKGIEHIYKRLAA